MIAPALSMIMGWIVRRIERRRSRRALNALTDAQLEDIGLSRSEIAGITHRHAEIDRLDTRSSR